MYSLYAPAIGPCSLFNDEWMYLSHHLKTKEKPIVQLTSHT